MPDPTTVGGWTSSWVLELSALLFTTAGFVLVLALLVTSVVAIVGDDRVGG